MLRLDIYGIMTAGLCLAVAFTSGCSNQDYINPTAIGRFRPTPVVNVILDSLGVGEEEPSVYAGAEEPRPSDLLDLHEDYIIGPGDVIRIAIFELLQQGLTDVRDYVVTESGRISVPEVGSVHAAGLTEKQLEAELKQILSPAILRQPTVTVSLQTSENRVFAVNGDGVSRPGRYPMPRSSIRLTDALAMAGSVGQFNVSYIYVSRQITGREGGQSARAEVSGRALPNRQGADLDDRIIAAMDVISEEELRSLASPGSPHGGIADINNGGDAAAGQIGAGAAASVEPDEERIEWVFRDGQWVPVRTGQRAVAPEQPPVFRQEQPGEQPVAEAEPAVPPSFGWDQLGTAGTQTRLIKIPVRRLLAGDPRYDIIIRPGDRITVPLDIVGEFCIYGNVNQVGYIPLTGRPMTLIGAIAAAGGLGPLAWPENVEVRRRIDANHEAIVMVNLRKIAEGTQPDFFIRPHDIINVGTHPSARWLAVLRNAFRATYGFGFIYDRNFADRHYQREFPLF